MRGSGATAIIVAAGRGQRLGAPEKVLLPLAGKPMLAYSLDAVEQASSITAVILVVGDHTETAVAGLLASGAWSKVNAVVTGGTRRQDSVAAGLAAVPAETEIVVVHDGARPLAPADLFDRCVATAAAQGAAIAAVPVADTLKRVADERIVGTVERDGLWAAQTPQAFQRSVLSAAIARDDGARIVTDDASLCEACGIAVAVVPGLPANLKITRPDDLAVAEALIAGRGSEVGGQRATRGSQSLTSSPERDSHSRASGAGVGGEGQTPDLRTGIGYDAHRLVPGRPLVLGGVRLEHPLGLDGHSDADVLLHAIADALLGAAALGDIGRHFPPDDPRFKDADSRELLRQTVLLVRDAGYAPLNVDATVIAEAPRLGPHVAAMTVVIAACLNLPASAVGVKATTNEGMGFVGRGEGIAALATAALASRRDG